MTTRPEETPVSTQPDTQVHPGAEAPATSTPDTAPPPAPSGEVITFPAPKVGPQHQTVMLHLMAGPMSRVHAWVEAGAYLGTYTMTTLPTFDGANVEPGDGQRFVFHVPSARRFISRPYDCEADARRAISNVLRTAEWVGLDLESPDPAELNRRVTAAQIKHPSRAQAIKNALSFGVLPHELAEKDAAARGEAPAASAAPAPAASPPPPPPPPPPGGKGLTSTPAASPTSSPKRLEPTSYGLGQGAPPAPPAPSPKKPTKGRGGKAPTKIPQAPVPSAKVQQRPSTIAPASAAATPAPTPPKKGRVSAASAARGKPMPAPTPAPSPSAPAKPPAPKASAPAPASSGPDELKAARAAPRTVKTSTFYPLTPASQHPDYAPRPIDPNTPPAGLSAKARASGIPELGGWEQKGEARYHLSSHQLDLVKVAGGWWWSKTGGPPISIGTGYPFGSPTQALSCLQRRYLNRLGWKSGPWSAFAASKGLT